MNTVTLGGTATINDLVSVARFGAKVAFSKEYEERVNHCRAHVDRFSHEGKAIYGLTTGLGDNWKKFIPEKDRETIQRNNIYAHTCAVGEPIAEECTRAMMFVMLCHFGSGHTGIRLETLALIRDMLNAGISPVVPSHGSVGYLTLEGHIGMVMIGEGKATYQGETLDGAEALKRAGLKPVVLSSKEGLILLSGTTSVTAFASLATYDAQALSLTADIAGSFTLEVLKGIDLSVNPGEVVTIIGASGSGKSTFLRCLNLLETPDAGHIWFHGQDLTAERCNINKLREDIGMVFQGFNLFNNKSVLDNCTLAPIDVKHIPLSLIHI